MSATKEEKGRGGNGRWAAVFALVAIAALVAGFYGVNDYAGGTGRIIKKAGTDSELFESAFRELMASRFRAMNLAAETQLQSRVVQNAFAHDDRQTVIERMEPLFAGVSKDLGVNQINFWTPPAKLFYRAGSPASFGMDLSAFRKTIVAANERRANISGVETGLGGVVSLRSVTPVSVDGKFVGVVEFGSSFEYILERSSEASGMKWAFSMMKEVSDRVERPVDPKVDSLQGSDVYFAYSDPATGETVRSIKFDPRAGGYSLAATPDGRTIFVRAFPIVNFSGVPTITVATLLDVTGPFAAVLKTVVLKAGAVWLVVSLLGSLGLIYFDRIKARLSGTIGSQKKELEERLVICEMTVSRLRDANLLKRGFISTLVNGVIAPLQAVSGQLQSLAPAVEGAGLRGGVASRLQACLAETIRLTRLVEDCQQIELFRQKLVKNDSRMTSLAEAAAQAVDETLLRRRQSSLSVRMAIPADLPPSRADGDLLGRAIGNLIAYAAQISGQGTITLTAGLDPSNRLELRLGGSAFHGAAAPSPALLEETGRFLTRLSAGQGPGAGSDRLVGVVLARVIVEFYGGTLAVVTASEVEPGFILHLPAAEMSRSLVRTAQQALAAASA